MRDKIKEIDSLIRDLRNCQYRIAMLDGKEKYDYYVSIDNIITYLKRYKNNLSHSEQGR